MPIRLTDEELIYILEEQLPGLLERHPELEVRVCQSFMKAFATKAEVAAVMSELQDFRAENRERFLGVDQRLDGMDKRFDGLDQRLESVELGMEAGFKDVQRSIDRLGSRWGIRNESLFRETIESILKGSFGVEVQHLTIEGEELDCLIIGEQHILVEISASVGPLIQASLDRKRAIYERTSGVKLARVILACASIHSHRAEALRCAGIEVIEPEEGT